MLPAEPINMLQTPQNNAMNRAGTKTMALRITPVRATSVGVPSRLPRDIASPPTILPARASAGAANENHTPTPGMGVVRKPSAVLASERIARRIEPIAMER
jgi:hypothetical protein